MLFCLVIHHCSCQLKPSRRFFITAAKSKAVWNFFSYAEMQKWRVKKKKTKPTLYLYKFDLGVVKRAYMMLDFSYCNISCRCGHADGIIGSSVSYAPSAKGESESQGQWSGSGVHGKGDFCDSQFSSREGALCAAGNPLLSNFTSD